MAKLKYFRKKLSWAWQNRLGDWRIRREILGKRQVIADLTRYEKRIRSQNGEDGILEAIFAKIGSTDRYLVEIGAADGIRCNGAHWMRNGWTGLMLDGREPRDLPERRRRRGSPVVPHQEFITAENVQDIFRKYQVPDTFDLLSIDIDGNDYWVWKEITDYQPRVVVMEYNATIPPDESRTITYDPAFVWDKTTYVGAGLLALVKLGKEKGYTLVGCNRSGVNAFFVQDALAQQHFAPDTLERLYRPPHRQLPDKPDAEWVWV